MLHIESIIYNLALGINKSNLSCLSSHFFLVIFYIFC